MGDGPKGDAPEGDGADGMVPVAMVKLRCSGCDVQVANRDQRSLRRTTSPPITAKLIRKFANAAAMGGPAGEICSNNQVGSRQFPVAPERGDAPGRNRRFLCANGSDQAIRFAEQGIADTEGQSGVGPSWPRLQTGASVYDPTRCLAGAIWTASTHSFSERRHRGIPGGWKTAPMRGCRRLPLRTSLT
jgi:hypothetical protein